MILRKAITLRYAAALSLVALAMIVSYALLVHRMSANADRAHIIDIAGMQRMYSQRTALMAREVVGAETSLGASNYTGKLASTLASMQANHAELTGPAGERYLSDDVRTLYDTGLTERLLDFFARGEAFLDSYRQSGHDDPRTVARMEDVVAIARNGLLEQLNLVVSAYEAEYRRAIADFTRLETFCLAFGLALLLFEILTIFRPMARVIDRHTRALETADGELREFSYRISHDLRAPIASSLGLVAITDEALQDGDTSTARITVARIGRSLGQLDVLIQDVIAVSRNKQMMQPVEPIDLDDLLNGAIEKLSCMPGFEAVRIDRDLQVGPAIRTQRIYLQQILENLISNAVKYADPNAPERRIEIHASHDGELCEVSIADNGIGVPESARADLFGMFRRFHPRVAFGSGLGLYLVRENAHAMGGEIDYHPLDHGSRFTLRFPTSS